LRDVPPAVPLGDRLEYVVELRNPTNKDIELDPCPAYYAAFGESASAATVRSYLNCDGAPAAVPAHGSVRFAMQMRISRTDDIQPGFVGSVYWRLPAAGPSEHWDDSSPDVRVVDRNG
jgi:hypothetical protein